MSTKAHIFGDGISANKIKNLLQVTVLSSIVSRYGVGVRFAVLNIGAFIRKATFGFEKHVTIIKIALSPTQRYQEISRPFIYIQDKIE